MKSSFLTRVTVGLVLTLVSMASVLHAETNTELFPKENTGLFLGGGFGFGQSYLTRGNTSPGFALDFSVEPGYSFKTGSWSRIEASGEVFFGRLGYRSSSTPHERGTISMYGVMPKFGYGYSLGDGVYAVWGLGVGPAITKYSARADGDVKIDSKDTVIGFAGRIFAIVLVPANDTLDIFAGVKYTHYTFDLGDVDVKTSTGTTTTSGDSIGMNVPEATLGIRLKL